MIAIVVGLTGLSGCVWAGLRFRRDDTTAIVNQQTQVVTSMQALNTELRLALEDCKRRGRRAE